jgi:hypothetical protein
MIGDLVGQAFSLPVTNRLRAGRRNRRSEDTPMIGPVVVAHSPGLVGQGGCGQAECLPHQEIP